MEFQKRILFLILAVFASFLSGISVFYSQGIAWPDEVFQTMEPAFRLVTGKGILTWEFEEKARSILYPFLLSVWMRGVFFFSEEPLFLYYCTRALLALLYVFSVLQIYSFYSEVRVSEEEADENSSKRKFFLFSVLFLLFPLNYYFGFRTLTESISASITIISVFGLMKKEGEIDFLPLIFFAFLLGMSYGIRFQMGLFLTFFIPPYLYQLWKTTDGKNKISVFLIGFTLGIISYVVSDFIYYGVPLISTYNYYYFNIVKKIAENWGTSPFYFYLQMYYRFFGLLLLFVFPGIFISFKRLYPILIGLFFFILIHSLISHKELRFVYFSFPILLYFIVLGIEHFYYFLKGKVKYGNLFLLLVFLLAAGQYYNVLTKKIQWNFCNSNLQTFLRASKAGVQGNSLIGVFNNFAWGGGYVYLGKNFNGELHFSNIKENPQNEVMEFLKSKDIHNILIYKTDKDFLCKNYGFCRELIEIEKEYIWMHN